MLSTIAQRILSPRIRCNRAMLQSFSSQTPTDPSPQQSSPPSQSPQQNQSQPSDLDRLITSCLSAVPAHGWTESAITAGVSNLGWSPAARGMLQGGAAGLALAAITRHNVQLAKHLSDITSNQSRRQRLAYAVMHRLSLAKPYQDTWRDALALVATPSHAPRTLWQSALLADEIAHFAGFSAPQFSWYTDRLGVAAIFQSAELYWLTDTSPENEDTRMFVERSINRASWLRERTHSVADSISSVSGMTTSTISTLLQSVRRSY